MPMSSPQRAALVLALTTGPVFAQLQWSSVIPSGAPNAHGGCAQDTTRQRLVAFGGEFGLQQFDVTSEWNGSMWQTINTTTRPASRRRPAMAYDRTRGVTVLFGGASGSNTFYGDTWTWNGTTWTPRTPAVAPSARSGAAMAFDSARQVVVLFGGLRSNGTDSNEVWEWDGTAWTQRLTAFGPSARTAHRMAFDQRRANCVLHGGFSTSVQQTLADTWTWNGTSWSTAASGPGSMRDQAMAYDHNRERVVLFGGLRIQSGGSSLDLAQTWEWNGFVWSLRPTTTSPSGRSGAAAGVDASGRFVVGGGANAAGTPATDTWGLLSAVPGTVGAFGNGCPSTVGPVALRTVTLPYTGYPFVQQVAGGPAGSIGIVIFGLSNTSWAGTPLPLALGSLSAPGCFLLVSNDVLVPVLLDGAGAGDVTWTLPFDPSLQGASFFCQGAVVDSALAVPLPLAFSSGRQFQIGAP